MTTKARIASASLDITVFLGGALVMVYEITGSRILSPYVGTSTYTWTSLIGVILAALAVGYRVGGSWADRDPRQSVLASALFAGGALVALTILLKDLVLTAVSAAPLPLEIKTILASLFLFAPAAVLMGFIVPYAVKLKTLSLDTTGATVGRLYALSTLGSIIGTFAAGFVLIPFVGSTRTLYAVAALLLLLSAILAPFASSRITAAVLTIFFLAAAFNEAGAIILRRSANLYDIDTRYSRVRVFDTTKANSGRPIRAMEIDPYIFQSSMYLDDGAPASEYHRFYHLVRYYSPGFRKVLMIGGAGYSFPKEYLEEYPGRRIEVVEIDPGMTELARYHFRLKDDPDLKIIHQDGRVFLNEAPEGAYDAVLMDAFTTLFSVPYQLTTVESAREVKKVLKNNGVVIFNIGTAIEGNAAKFLGAELNTYRQVFPKVSIFVVDPSKRPGTVQNVILVAFKSPDSNYIAASDEQIRKLLANEIDTKRIREFPILTDDLAPVEYYSSFAQRRFVRELK